MIGVLEVRKIFKITMLLLAGLLSSANVSAYTVVGGVVYGGDGSGAAAAGNYLGHIGNVHDELPVAVRNPPPDAPVNPNWIGTDYIYTGLFGPSNPFSYTPNPVPGFDSLGTTYVQWFQFSSNTAGLLNAYYEWGVDIESFDISFYASGDTNDDQIFSKTITSAEFLIGHLYHNLFANFPAGEVLMRIEGHAIGGNDGYKVQLYSAVPLPPAALLFISALAAFGVIGRKKVLSA